MVIDVILDAKEDMEKYGGLVVFDDDEGESKLVKWYLCCKRNGKNHLAKLGKNQKTSLSLSCKKAV